MGHGVRISFLHIPPNTQQPHYSFELCKSLSHISSDLQEVLFLLISLQNCSLVHLIGFNTELASPISIPL